MKWTNHDRLDLYGVRLVGWPPDIPLQNPSTLKVSQNKQLLDSFRNGTIRFERLATSTAPPPAPAPAAEPEDENNDDLSWALNTDLSPTVRFWKCLRAPFSYSISKIPSQLPPSRDMINAVPLDISPHPTGLSPLPTRENTPLTAYSGCDPYGSSSILSRQSTFEDLDWDNDDIRYRKRARGDGFES